MDNVKLLLRNGSLQQLLTSNNVLGVAVWCLLQDSIFLFYPLYLLCVFWQYKLPLTVALIPPTLGYTIITYSINRHKSNVGNGRGILYRYIIFGRGIFRKSWDYISLGIRLGKFFVSRLVFFANIPPRHDIYLYIMILLYDLGLIVIFDSTIFRQLLFLCFWHPTQVREDINKRYAELRHIFIILV